MKTKQIFIASALALSLTSLPAQAALDVFLDDLSFNLQDGTNTFGFDPLFDGSLEADGTINASPLASIDLNAFDLDTGLGFITASISGAGNVSFNAFFDHSLLDADNLNDFDTANETGSTSGTAHALQSWEIDEPGFDILGLGYFGDIFDNAANFALDNAILEDAIGPFPGPNDLSMAMGWDFDLGLGGTAEIVLSLSDIAPTAAFYLEQIDGTGAGSIYLSSSLSINGVAQNPAPGAVPEPSIILLMGIGMAGMVATRRRMKKPPQA